MKLNENVKIVGTKVILIPYEAKHVEKYHAWMQNEELLKLTASEPLTLEEEYDMQRSWRNDEDKLTFLILDKIHYETTTNEIESLIGDSNIFIKDETEKTAEVEIMIAEPSARGKGIGWESLLLLLKYSTENLNLKLLQAIIGESNSKSINMFKKLRFEQKTQPNVFQEISFERVVNEEWGKWLNSQIEQYSIQQYSSDLSSVQS